MFSKAKLRRFNEEVGCAPPSTKYDPKLVAGCAGNFSVPKSDRFVQPKFVAPGPGQYQDQRLLQIPSTPRTAASRRSRMCSGVGSVRSLRSQPWSIDSSVRSDGSTSGHINLETEIAELRAKNEELQAIISQLRALEGSSAAALLDIRVHQAPLITSSPIRALKMDQNLSDNEEEVNEYIDAASKETTPDGEQQELMRCTVMQLLDSMQLLESRLAAAEQLQQRTLEAVGQRSRVAEQLARMSDRLQRLDATADGWKLERQISAEQLDQMQLVSQQQSTRVKELELLVQVARESEVVAHDACCSLQDRLHALEEYLSDSQQHCAELTASRDELSVQLASVTDDLLSTRAQCDDAEQEALLVISRHDELEVDMQRAQDNTRQAQTEVDELRRALLEAQNRMDSLVGRCDSEQRCADGLRNLVETAEAERAETELRLAAVEGHFAAAVQERDELLAMRAQLAEQLQAGEETKQRTAERISGLERRCGELRKELDSVKQTAETRADESATLQRQRDSVMEQLTAARAELANMGCTLADETEARDLAASDLWYAGLKERLTAQDAQQEMGTALQRKEEAIRRLEAVHAEKQSQLHELAVRSDSMQRDIERAVSELEQARSETVAERVKTREWQERETQRQQTVVETERRLQQVQRDFERVSDQLEEKEMAVSQLDQQVDEWKQQVLMLSHELCQNSRELNRLETDNCEKDDQISVIQCQVETLTERLTSERAAFDYLNSENSDLAEKLSEQDAEKCRITEELNEMTACADEQIERRCRLEQNVLQLEQRLTSETEALCTKENMLIQMNRDLTSLASNRDELKLRSEELALELDTERKRAHKLQRECDLTTEKCQMLDTKLHETEEALKMIQSDGEQAAKLYEAEMNVIGNQLCEVQTQKNLLENDLRVLEQRFATEAEVRVEKDGMLAQMKQELTSLEQGRDELKLRLESLDADLKNKHGQNEYLKQERDSARDKCDGLVSKLHNAEEIIKEIRSKSEEITKKYSLDITTLRDQLFNAQARSANLENDLSEVRHCLAVETETVCCKIALVDQVNDKLKDLSLDRDEQRARSDKLAVDLEVREQINLVLQSEFDSTTQQCELIAAKLRGSESTVDELKSRIDASTARHQRDVATIREQMHQTEAQCNALETDLNALQTKHDQTLSQSDTLRAEAFAALERARMARDGQAAAEAARDEVCKRAGRLTSQLEHQSNTQREQMLNVQRERDQLTSKLLKLEQDHDDNLKSLYEQFTSMRSRLSAALQKEEQLVAAKEYIERLKQSLTAAERCTEERSLAVRDAELRLRDQQTADEWRQKYERLASLVEPFQSELDQYEAERNCLLSQREGTRAEMERLSVQYSQLLGHQNKKQKIHHIMKLKEENLLLKKRNADMEKDMRKQHAKLRHLEERLAGGGSTLLNATMSSKAKSKSSYDFSKSVADTSELKENLALLAVTPLRENTRNRLRGSPVAASSSVKSFRQLDFA